MLIAILSYSDAWYFDRVILANFMVRKWETTREKTLGLIIEMLILENNVDIIIRRNIEKFIVFLP